MRRGQIWTLLRGGSQYPALIISNDSNGDFIGKKVDEAVKQGEARRLRFVLGTEAGMITSIVRRVRKLLSAGVE